MAQEDLEERGQYLQEKMCEEVPEQEKEISEVTVQMSEGKSIVLPKLWHMVERKTLQDT